MRILLYTGKGGVGKTSVSAASALRCAELGYRTVVLSTDSAHSLGDSFNTRIGNELVELAPNLWGQEIDLLHQMDKYWGRVQDYLNVIFSWRGMDSLIAEETSVLPGMEELASLMHITHLAESGDYDTIIIDAAPTGSTLQLLSFPDIARWYIEKIMPFERRTLQIARPIMSRVSNFPLPDDDIFESVEDLVDVLERTSLLLGDSSVSSMRLVINPEKMVIKEAQRAYACLNLYGYAVDSVVCNRVFPQELQEAYFSGWIEAQQRNLGFVEEAFHPLPICRIPFFEEEVLGQEMLQRMAASMFGADPARGGSGDPTRLCYQGEPQKIFAEDGHYILSIALPLVAKEEVNLHRSVVDELIIRIGNWKRNISLPIGLARLEIDGAKYEGDRLNILFCKEGADSDDTDESLQRTPWRQLKARLQGKVVA